MRNFLNQYKFNDYVEHPPSKLKLVIKPDLDIAFSCLRFQAARFFSLFFFFFFKPVVDFFPRMAHTSESLARLVCTFYRTNKLHFSATFSLKMGLTSLITHLKIILLFKKKNYFTTVFSVFSKISCVQTDF